MVYFDVFLEMMLVSNIGENIFSSSFLALFLSALLKKFMTRKVRGKLTSSIKLPGMLCGVQVCNLNQSATVSASSPTPAHSQGHLHGTHPLEAATCSSFHRKQSTTLTHDSRDLQEARNPTSAVRQRKNVWTPTSALPSGGAYNHGVTRIRRLRRDELSQSKQTRNVWVLCNV